jgi:WD40 repeat protein
VLPEILTCFLLNDVQIITGSEDGTTRIWGNIIFFFLFFFAAVIKAEQTAVIILFFGVNKLVFLNTLVNLYSLLDTYVIVTYFLDCKSGKCIQVIDPAKHLKLKGPVSWVGSVALDASESWLVSEYLLFCNTLSRP